VSFPYQDFIFCRNILSKRFSALFFFTHIHLMRRLSSIVNLIAVTILLLTSILHRCQQRTFKKNTNYFYVVVFFLNTAYSAYPKIQCSTKPNGVSTEQQMVFLPKLVDWLLRRSWSSCWNKIAYLFCYMLCVCNVDKIMYAITMRVAQYFVEAPLYLRT